MTLLICLSVNIFLLIHNGRAQSSSNDGETLVNEISGASVTKNSNDSIIELFNNKCKCVFYYQCDENNFIITDGGGLLNYRIRSKTEVKRIPCFTENHVCCNLNITVETKSTKATPKPSSDKPGKDRPKCGLLPQTDFEVRIKSPEKDTAGTTIGEIPWIVAIYAKTLENEQYTFKCAGSLIHPKVVLTATHCVRSAKKNLLKVVIKGETLSENLGSRSESERQVSNIIKHPEYYSGGLYNDIALIILEEPYNLTMLPINTICLPESNQSFVGSRCIAAGWGANDQSVDRPLRKVDVPVVESQRCQSLLRNTRLKQSFNLHSSFLCAGGEEGKDTCNGDGGGPLACLKENDDHYIQAGIVSWGVQCGAVDVPSFYTDVAKFRDWIDSELKKENITI